MARRGKAVFDVSVMAGWAFATALAGLAALVMVDMQDEKAGVGDIASLDNADSRLVTGSIGLDERATSSVGKPAVLPPRTVYDVPKDGSGSPEDFWKDSLVKKQNKTFDPFERKKQLSANGAPASQNQANPAKQVPPPVASPSASRALTDVEHRLNQMRREIQAFHTSTQKLREENSRLKHRLEKLELERKQRNVRVVDLPKQGEGLVREVDPQATGSIRPANLDKVRTQRFNPFDVPPQANVKLREQPLDMDLASGMRQDSVNGQGLPRAKPKVAPTMHKNMRPASKVISSPIEILKPSQTSFAVDLGQFVSLAELKSAWTEISNSQSQVIGDLQPVSAVNQTKAGHLALNLRVGPMQNASQAAQICAILESRGYSCSVAPFQGQAIALKR